MAVALAIAYGTNTDRFPVFDEFGLDNPIYEYLHRGRMAYPAHGYPDAMFVHPPTHYYVSAQFMRLGFPLLTSTVLPVLLFTLLSTFLIASGRFRFPVALSLVLGQFCAVFIWADMMTVRPELHVAIAWFTGLVALQAAHNCNWSPWRLFLGAAACTYASMLHYWATPAFLAVAVYALPLLRKRPLSRLKPQLLAIGMGGGLVGGLYLGVFVVPHFSDIVAFAFGVQSQGSGWQDALNRHIEAYQQFGTRLFYGAAAGPLVLPAPRWFIDALLTPLFTWRIPAVFVFLPVLLSQRDTRLLGIAGSIVPLFVLFYSQGKPVGYNGYYVPEILLYLFACLLIVTTTLSLLSKAAKSATTMITAMGGLVVAACCLVQVPVTMQSNWRFGARNDVFELLRAAAFDIVGPGSTIAITSVPSWYIGGGTVVWQAANALTLANPDRDASRPLGEGQRVPRIRRLLAPFDAVVSDPAAWWMNWSRGAPLNDWYARGLLQLRGFVFRVRPPGRRGPGRRQRGSGTASFAELLYKVSTDDLSVKGYLMEDDRVYSFVESDAGQEIAGDLFWLAVFSCSRQPTFPLPEARLVFTFPLRTEPEPSAPHLLFVAGRADVYGDALGRIDASCEMRDAFRGHLAEVSAESLKSRLRAGDQYIRIVTDRSEALAGRSTATPGLTLAEWSGEKLANDAEQVRYSATRSSLLRRDSSGGLMFVPTTPDDHIALPWVSIEGGASESERTIEVVVKNGSGSEGPCTAMLQDRAFNSLATLKCDGAGIHRTFANIGETVERVRVVFVSPNRQSMRLPDAIVLVDHEGL